MAANIAFGLACLGLRPLLIGSVGPDFAEYRAWLERHRVDTSGVRESVLHHTARFVATTDLVGNQIAPEIRRRSTATSPINRQDAQVRSGFRYQYVADCYVIGVRLPASVPCVSHEPGARSGFPHTRPARHTAVDGRTECGRRAFLAAGAPGAGHHQSSHSHGAPSTCTVSCTRPWWHFWYPKARRDRGAGP